MFNKATYLLTYLIDLTQSKPSQIEKMDPTQSKIRLN